MEPMDRAPAPQPSQQNDLHDLSDLKAPGNDPLPAPPEDASMSSSRGPRRRLDAVTVRAPDASTYAEALKTAIDAGLNVTGSDFNRKTIDIRGPIDSQTLDTLVNQLGCTVTPQRQGPIMTTMALGEESQGWPPHERLTQAIPEEGIGRPGPDIDELPEMTTQAVGEEGQAHPR